MRPVVLFIIIIKIILRLIVDIIITLIVLTLLVVLIDDVLFQDVLFCFPLVKFRRSFLAVSTTRRLFCGDWASVFNLSSLLRRVTPSPSTLFSQHPRLLNFILTSTSCWFHIMGFGMHFPRA